MFRARFRDGLWSLHRYGQLGFHGALDGLAENGRFAALFREALRKPWTVYAKRPFAGPEQVLAYLSRYTHRVAIGSGRLTALDLAGQTVTFRYKDYRDQHRQKQMTLSTVEFLRRFCLHILPPRFVKIRHYGLTGNHERAEKIAAARAALKLVEGQTKNIAEKLYEPAHCEPQACCPRCGSPRLLLVRHQLPGPLLSFDSS